MTPENDLADHVAEAHGDAKSAVMPDAAPANWVDLYAPVKLRPYLRLGRFDRPIGTWLLLLPCWWSVSLAELNSGRPFPDFGLLALFAVGALAMRAAGCAYNDLVDRDIDARVARTAMRPVASGQISPRATVIYIACLAFIGLGVVMLLNPFARYLAIGSLLVVLIYPFAKRITHYPQFVLGLAFNWGALVGWAAVTGSLDWAPVFLYIGCVVWTVGYDTIYAHQDKEDDALIGLGSTALKFGHRTISIVGALYGTAVIFWMIAGALAGAHLIYFFAVTLVFLQMSWQVATLNTEQPDNCLRRFRSNRDVGFAVFLGLMADMALSWFAAFG